MNSLTERFSQATIYIQEYGFDSESLFIRFRLINLKKSLIL